ncbi:hypothetical protein [Alcanivorax sp. 1008]|uniref:hypothetical protein n=1 Tax=Alcanivorax sp. 1008 TaxID=2816853 RepID=UPI001D20DEBB|nr:hypothetical protein [Alcanivorax sp. 1008]MCC1496856.1 hypothetical protein [Alcanivorax sp. 1008]
MNSQLKKSDVDAAVADFAAVVQDRYGMTLEDFGLTDAEMRQSLSMALVQGGSPSDVAEWYARKYDLVDLHDATFR